MKTAILGTIGQALSGRVQLSIVDARTKQVIRELPWQKNLILNQGMDNFGNGVFAYFAHGFTYACAGTGTTPTQDDSGVTQATQVGTTVTLSGGAFTFTNTGTDAGKYIKWDTAEEARIVTVTSPTQVEVHVTQAVPAAEFTVYRTGQTGLTTELKRTNSYVLGVGNTETTLPAPHIMLMRRTFDFTAEAGPVSYSEVGLSHSNLVAANLFSRVLLAVPLALIAGQQLRLKYELSVVLSPANPVARNPAPITGWPQAPVVDCNGDEGIETSGAFGQVSGSGGSNAVATDCNELNAGSYLVVHTSAIGTIAPVPATSYFWNTNSGELIGYSTSPTVKDAYVNGSYTGSRYYSVPANLMNVATIRSIGLGGYNGNRCTGFRFYFDLAQNKDSLHKLTIRFRWTWSRVF